MAFMMPVMKKNYNIYGDRQQRRPSIEGTDGHGRKISQGSATGRKVRSEGPSLSTSPAARGAPELMNGGVRVMKNSTKPIPMRRGRGSAPVLAVNSVPFHRNNSLPGGPSTAPAGNSPAPVSPTHSTGSSTSSSEETSGTPHHRFHLKLIQRLRKSFRMKDPAPAAS